MSDDSRSVADVSGSENRPLIPSSQSEISRSIPDTQHGQPILAISTTNVELNYQQAPSPADEFAKYPSIVQAVIIQELVDKGRHKIAYDNRQQKFDFAAEIMRLLFPFILGLILIVGSIHLILSGQTKEGLMGLAGSVLF